MRLNATKEQADAMTELANALHQLPMSLIPEGGVCVTVSDWIKPTRRPSVLNTTDNCFESVTLWKAFK